MRGKNPNQSTRINRNALTKKKNNAATVAVNEYFFGNAIATNPPAPIFIAFGR